MIGNPKYKKNDKVVFVINDQEKIGTIEIIDAYGTFFDKSDVSYDILVLQENMLYKHINEKFVIRKVD